MQSSRESVPTEKLHPSGMGIDSDSEIYWPPPRTELHRATIQLVNLFCLPKDGEQRPRYEGRRGECHNWHRSELSGLSAPPNSRNPSSCVVTISLHPIGGVCAVSKRLPLPKRVEAETTIPASSPANGLNVSFDGVSVHCVAAEPHATFLHIGVSNGRKEVAYETAVLGRLRRGHRVFLLRGVLGTRIELCCVLVFISFGTERNLWPTPRQVLHLLMNEGVRPHDFIESGESTPFLLPGRAELSVQERMELAVSGRRKLVNETCNILKAEMGHDVETSAWRELSKLRPQAVTTAIALLEARVKQLVSQAPAWYNADAKLMLGLTVAINAKTAVSSWPKGLAVLQERCGSSLANLFEVKAMTVQAHDKSAGPEGAYGACALLVLGSKLQELILTGNRLGTAGAEMLSHTLLNNTTLRVLGLAGSQLAPNVATAGAMHICLMLETNSTLTKLSLADNALDGKDHEFKTALHRALQRNRSLVDVDLRYNRNMGWAGADAVLDAKAPLRRVNLLNTCVGVRKAQQLAMLDVDTLCGLNGDDTKFLAANMALDSGDAVLLAAELSGNGSRLIDIDLSHNQLRDRALEALTSAMQGSTTSLRRLAVVGNFFTEAAMEKLSNVARLKEISLDLSISSQASE